VACCAAPLLTELQTYYTPEVAADLRTEPILLFDHILGENRSLLELLTADYTFLTERLVRFYQLEGKVAIAGNDFQKVTWPDTRRGGVTQMGAVLALNSHYAQTSPVLRGAWVLETLLGTPVPPPPPNVPPLDPDRKLKQLSVRERLEQHRVKPVCASCHKIMDPIGFSLENFDLIGKWRETDGGVPINSSGVLVDGTALNNSADLKKALLSRSDAFVTTASEKLLTYALGRALDYNDMPTVRSIVRDASKNGERFSSLVIGVAKSAPFQTKLKK
jgi:hypothetical protein